MTISSNNNSAASFFMTNTSSSVVHSYRQWPADKIIRLFVLLLIMCATLIGNSYIVLELFCRRRRHRTRLHLFILNLAVGDLAICLCTMTSELFLLVFDQEWILGNLACKITLYIQVVTLASTTFINVAMTYDRYEAICCPFRSCTANRRVHRIILICWLSSLVVAIPQLFIFKESPMKSNPAKCCCASKGYTAEWQRRVYFTIFACYVLIIPVVCMTVWYVKIIQVVASSTKVWIQKIRGQATTFLSSSATSPAKLKTVKLALTIIIVFVMCWTPYMVATLVEIYSNGRLSVPNWLDGVLQMICLAQSGVNPLIYRTFNHRRKSTPTIILASARSGPMKSPNRRRVLQSTASSSMAESSFKMKEHYSSSSE